MAREKKATTSKEVFVLTLPMRCQPWQIDKMDRMFQCYNNIKNALIAKKLNALKQVERTREWRELRNKIALSYKAIEDAKTEDAMLAALEAQKPLFSRRKEILAASGLYQDAFEKAMVPARRHYKGITNSLVAQKLADNVWSSFDAYLYEGGEEIHFSKIDEFLCVEGKNNATGIVYYPERKEVKILNMVFPVVLNKKDPYGYETEALTRKIHFCKVCRKAGPNGWKYFLQLVLAGKPPVKIKSETGELLYPLGKGRVGNDIGPQTLATVSDTTASLRVFCEEAQDIQNELRCINRAMDRSRRATNPKMFYADGTVVPIDKLPEECIRMVRGAKRRKWTNSKRYMQLMLYRRYLYRKQREARIQTHNELANKLLPLGDLHYIEKMNWQALAKRAKKTEVSEKTGKYKRKKRFGKSIANKAPALFVNIYSQKVIAAGGTFVFINTQDAKASQYDHQKKAYKKKHLSQRWNTMSDGSRIQRDLYSAFLIQNTNEEHNGFLQELLDAKYPKFKEMHDIEIQCLSTVSMPSSAGVKRAV